MTPTTWTLVVVASTNWTLVMSGNWYYVAVHRWLRCTTRRYKLGAWWFIAEFFRLHRQQRPKYLWSTERDHWLAKFIRTAHFPPITGYDWPHRPTSYHYSRLSRPTELYRKCCSRRRNGDSIESECICNVIGTSLSFYERWDAGDIIIHGHSRKSCHYEHFEYWYQHSRLYDSKLKICNWMTLQQQRSME